MFKKIKNNKGLGSYIIGLIVIMILVFSVARAIDIFYQTIVKREMKTQIEQAQLYGLVKGVDVQQARETGRLVVNERIAKEEFFNHYHEMLDGYSMYINSIESSEQEPAFIELVKVKNSDYMSGDNKKRDFISAKSTIYIYPRSYFKRTKPTKIQAVTRILVDMDDIDNSNVVEDMD